MDVLCVRPRDRGVECDGIGAGHTIGVAIPPRRGCVVMVHTPALTSHGRLSFGLHDKVTSESRS
eukprot:2844204-Prymnesium_polylepis.1